MVIWSSRDDPTSRKVASNPQDARLRGTFRSLVAGTIGAIVHIFVSTTAGTFLLTLAGIVLLTALISPTGLYAGIESAFRLLGLKLAQALSWILLGGVFYLFFVPFGLLFRRGGKDPMKRSYDAEAASYWSPRQPRRSRPDSYRRQF